MTKKKKSPTSGEVRLDKKSVQLVNTANRIIGNSSDPVKLIGDLIQYHRLSAKMYRQNARVK